MKKYPSDFKFASSVRKNIKNKNSSELLSLYFKNEIFNDSENDRFNGFYIHTCGEQFQSFRYRESKKSNNLNSSMIYKNNGNGKNYHFELNYFNNKKIY